MIRLLTVLLAPLLVVALLWDDAPRWAYIAALGLAGAVVALIFLRGRVIPNCPYCGKAVKFGATQCHHCGRDVTEYPSNPTESA